MNVQTALEKVLKGRSWVGNVVVLVPVTLGHDVHFYRMKGDAAEPILVKHKRGIHHLLSDVRESQSGERVFRYNSSTESVSRVENIHTLVSAEILAIRAGMYANAAQNR